MASPKLKSGWISLAKVYDVKSHGFDFITVFDKKRNSLYAIHREPSKGLSQYSFDKNTWTKCDTTPSFEKSWKFVSWLSWKARAIDCDQQKLFINHDFGSIALFTFNDDSKIKLEIVNASQTVGDGYASKGIVINNDYHIIGGDGNKHSKYDPIKREIQILHDFKNIAKLNEIEDHQIVRTKNKILLFGGVQGKKVVDAVYEYDIIGNVWTELNYKLPTPLRSFACTTILNGQYIALFGGYNGFCRIEDIFIYSLRDKEFMKSNTKCPSRELAQAFAISNIGYLRTRWKKCGMNDHLFPPQYLMQIIICGYYWNEYIHLIQLSNSCHYKINVFELFD